MAKWKKRRLWTAATLATLRALYPDTPTWQLARRFKRPTNQIYAKANADRPREERRSTSPVRTRVACAAATRSARRSASLRATCRRTRDCAGRAGHRPHGGDAVQEGQANHNVMPIGATRLVDGYLYIKVAAVRYVPYMVNWLPLHILNWERANGRPLPKRALPLVP
jgi:hypothetical protein